MSFVLSMDQFSGPLDVLVSMIEKKKLPATDISLVQVTDDFLTYLNTLPSEHVFKDKIHFVYIGSILALLKARSLLPTLHLTDHEEEDIEELKKRLIIYQSYQTLGKKIKPLVDRSQQQYYPRARRQKIIFSPTSSIEITQLESLIFELLKETPEPIKKEREAHIQITIHINDIMNRIQERLLTLQSYNFNSMLKEELDQYEHPKDRRVYTVVSFLAILELVRNHGYRAEQQEVFNDIALAEGDSVVPYNN